MVNSRKLSAVALLLLLIVQTIAQEITDDTVGIVSFIDIYIDPNSIADSVKCLSEGDLDLKRACFPNTEVIHVPTFEKCIKDVGNLADCKEDPVYQVPFITEKTKNEMDKDIDKAWAKFVDKVLQEVGDEIVKFPPCHCSDIVQCTLDRTKEGIKKAVPKNYTIYWQDVYKAVANHAPMALHWQNPIYSGAIITPFYDFEPKPEQYKNLIEEPRDLIYYFSTESTPYLPKELNKPSGGLTKKEKKKVTLEEATLLEYQKFGFTAMWQLFGKWAFQLALGARLGVCIAGWIGPVPIIIPMLYPVAVPLYVIKAFKEDVIIPEGYTIPKVKGKPLF